MPFRRTCACDQAHFTGEVIHIVVLHPLILGHVYTYPDIFESASFSFRIWLPSASIRWIRHTKTQLFESALQHSNFWVRYESRMLCTINPEILIESNPANSFKYFTAIVLFITALTALSCFKESGSHNREGSLITMAVNLVRATSLWQKNKTIIKVNSDTLYLLLLIFFKTFPFRYKVWVPHYSSCEEGPFDKQFLKV